jgi:Flp pilus assembly protein TadG
MPDLDHVMERVWRRLREDPCGSTAVEFAILSPILLLLLLGTVVYGGYFMLAHSLQQMANDAARAAVSGLSASERQTLASDCMVSELGAYSYLQPRSLQLGYQQQGQVATVQLAYDASGSPLWALNGLLPMPAPLIVRTASVRLGGY